MSPLPKTASISAVGDFSRPQKIEVSCRRSPLPRFQVRKRSGRADREDDRTPHQDRGSRQAVRRQGGQDPRREANEAFQGVAAPARGAAAFSGPEVAHEARRDRGTKGSDQEGSRPTPAPGPRPLSTRNATAEERQAARTKMQETQAKVLKDILAVLDEKQLTSWKEMTGKEFKFPQGRGTRWRCPSAAEYVQQLGKTGTWMTGRWREEYELHLLVVYLPVGCSCR